MFSRKINNSASVLYNFRFTGDAADTLRKTGPKLFATKDKGEGLFRF